MTQYIQFRLLLDPDRTGNPDKLNALDPTVFEVEVKPGKKEQLIDRFSSVPGSSTHKFDKGLVTLTYDAKYTVPTQVELAFPQASHGGQVWIPSIDKLVTVTDANPVPFDVFYVLPEVTIKVQAHLGGDAVLKKQLKGKKTYACDIHSPHEIVPARFSLYRGSAVTGQPLATVQTNDVAPAEFDDLDAGPYCVAITPVTTAHGHEIELVAPDDGIVHVIAVPGATVDLSADAFVFGLYDTTVKVNIVDADSGEAVSGCSAILTRASDKGKPEPKDDKGSPGTILFEHVAAGKYHVQLASLRFTADNGFEYVVKDRSPLEVTVARGKPAIVTLQVERDIHAIKGFARMPDGTPIPFGVIDVFVGHAKDPIDSVFAGEDGAYYWLAPNAGTYYLAIREHEGLPTRRTEVVVNSVASRDIIASGQAPDPGGRGRSGGGGDDEAGTDVTAYPLWTEEVSYPATTRGSAPSGAATGALGPIVEGAIRDVLGWRPDANKPDAFVTALTQSFALREFEGHVEYTWTPKSYAVQTDMGAVTGAQASIFNRATVALDQCLPLLDGLYPLRADTLPEDLESMRSVIRSQLSQLVSEFGVLGGPRPQRVEELFKLLMGDIAITNPERISGFLNTLRDRFGLERGRVNTIEDEQDLTNFLILVDYVIGLAQSWRNQRAYFDVTSAKGPEPFLGTQLVLLSRALDVVAELVNDANFAMDSVFLGPAERGSIQLRFANPPLSGHWQHLRGRPGIFGSDLFVGDLMDWVARVATEEGPSLIKYGGKDGVIALVPILEQLRHLTRGALLQPVGLQDPARLTPAYRTPRVQRSLLAVADQLDECFNYASKIKPPELKDVVELVQDRLQLPGDLDRLRGLARNGKQASVADLTSLVQELTDRLAAVEEVQANTQTPSGVGKILKQI